MPNTRIVNLFGFDSSGARSINELSIDSYVVDLTYRTVPCFSPISDVYTHLFFARNKAVLSNEQCARIKAWPVSDEKYWPRLEASFRCIPACPA